VLYFTIFRLRSNDLTEFVNAPEELSKAVKLVSDKMITEASGGITESNIVDYAKTGVDYISSGALTNSVRSLDLSLKIVK